MEKRDDNPNLFPQRSENPGMEPQAAHLSMTRRLELQNYAYNDRSKISGGMLREEEGGRYPYHERVFPDYSFPYSINDGPHSQRPMPYETLQHFPKPNFIEQFNPNNLRRGFSNSKEQNMNFSGFDGYPFAFQASIHAQRQDNTSVSDNPIKDSTSNGESRNSDAREIRGTKTSLETCSETHDVLPGFVFTCGGCKNVYSTICKLHDHMHVHVKGGSYMYDHEFKTAFPRFDSVCTSTQTAMEDFVSDDLESKEREGTDEMPFEDISDRKTEEKHVEGNENNTVSSDAGQDEDEDSDESADINKAVSDVELKDEAQELIDQSDHYSSDTEEEWKPILKVQLKTGRKRGRPRKNPLPKPVKKPCKTKPTKSSTRTRKNLIKKSLKIKVEMKEKKKSIPCNKCDKVFRFNLELKRHLQTEHGVGVDNYCRRCREQFDTKAEFMEHKKVHQKGRFECDQCKQVYSTRKLLEDHINWHTGNKPFTCDICGKAFRTKGQMNFHKKQYHCPSYTQQCEYCGKVFTCRYKMKDHVRYCLGIKPFKCDLCDKAFIRSNHLKQHRRLHTGERMYVCDQCGLNLSSQTSLKKHKMIHTGEKPFQCDQCSMAFTARSTLVDHQRTHTQDKRFTCTYCGRSFIKKWNLKTHERQHTGETPYKCTVCGQGFKQNVLLKTHVQSHEKHSREITAVPHTTMQSDLPFV